MGVGSNPGGTGSQGGGGRVNVADAYRHCEEVTKTRAANFSYGLKENLQFAGTHLLVSLFSFNVGIEIGQVAVLAVMLPALALLRRYVLAGRIGVIILSALIAHTGWHWMIDRGDILWKTEWPRLDAASFAILARWVAGLLIAAAAVRFIGRRAGAFLSRKPAAQRPS